MEGWSKKKEDENLTAVARQISEQLGYNVLVLREYPYKPSKEEDISKSKREASLKHLEMMDILGAVNAPPFKEKMVKVYKKARRIEAVKRWRVARTVLMVFSEIALITLFTATGIVGFYGKQAEFLGPAIGLGLSLVIGLAYVSRRWRWVRTDDVLPWEERVIRWQRISLREYYQPIPASILQTILEIKKRLPGVKFLVEELENDPFLIANYGDRDYYIAVWDEAGFEVRPAA